MSTTKARLPLAVFILGLGIFTQGTSEFMLSGLIPGIAGDLDVSIPQAGLLVSAFAIGMVIGAPLLAVATLNWPRRTTLIAFQAVFIAAHIVGALAPGYGVLFATRVISATVYAGFWSVAVATAVSMVSVEAKARAVAVVAGGLTLATIIGVPAGTLISDMADWRATFWTVSIGTVVSLVATIFAVPRGTGDSAERRTVRAEVRAMANGQLWLSYALTALAFGAFMVTFSYIAPLLTDITGLPESWMPALLAVVGVGGLVGMTIGGRTAGPRPIRTLAIGTAVLAIGSVVLALSAAVVTVTIVLLFVVGFGGYITNPVLQSRVFVIAPQAPTMAGAGNIAAFNVGNAVAPALGGLTIGAGLGFTSVAWVGAALAALAFVGTLWAGHLQYRASRGSGSRVVTRRSPADAQHEPEMAHH